MALTPEENREYEQLRQRAKSITVLATRRLPDGRFEFDVHVDWLGPVIGVEPAELDRQTRGRELAARAFYDPDRPLEQMVVYEFDGRKIPVLVADGGPAIDILERLVEGVRTHSVAMAPEQEEALSRLKAAAMALRETLLLYRTARVPVSEGKFEREVSELVAAAKKSREPGYTQPAFLCLARPRELLARREWQGSVRAGLDCVPWTTVLEVFIRTRNLDLLSLRRCA